MWGWDDGTSDPQNHPGTGVPRPWHEALHLEGAGQVVHLAELFASIQWWRLTPAPELVADQPGGHRHISASRSHSGDLALIYVPEDRRVELNLSGLRSDLMATWVSASSGARVLGRLSDGHLATPAVGDWWLVIAADS